jgi:glyoxylase-like metal-dependent hydrolase (beta-lactamase superfamily II)
MTMTTTSPLTIKTFLSSDAGLNSVCSLIQGSTDSVLVDVPFLLSDARNLVQMVKDSGTRLTTIFVTHGHPDHWFTLSLFAEEFPEAKMVAHPKVAEQIEGIREKKFKQWKPVFGDEIGEKLVGPTAMSEMYLTLEGRELPIIYVAVADSEEATLVWVPELETLIVGDLGSSDTHVYMAEHDAALRAEFLRSVYAMGDLSPKTIIPGHMDVGSSMEADYVIKWTADYLTKFEEIVSDNPTEEEYNKRAAEAWGEIPVAFAVPLNAAAALRGEYF